MCHVAVVTDRGKSPLSTKENGLTINRPFALESFSLRVIVERCRSENPDNQVSRNAEVSVIRVRLINIAKTQ